MGILMKRGGAAALLGLTAVLPLGAQSAGAVITRRDSNVTIRIAAPSKAMMDSIVMLMHALDAEPANSAAAVALRQRIEAFLPAPQTATVFMGRRGGPPPSPPQGWLGFTAQGPKAQKFSREGELLIQYFDYPSIIAVDPESPAQRAGIETGDVLLAYNGLDVRSHEFNLTQLLVPERKVAVTVRRDGETKDYSLTAARAPVRITMRRESGDFGGDVRIIDTLIMQRQDEGRGRGHERVMVGPSAGRIIFTPKSSLFSPNGAFGAILSSVSPDLAKTLKLEPGVLVNDVSDDTPASKAGLHTGDVIVSVSGQTVASLKALQEIVRMHIAEQTVALKVVRDRKSRSVTVSW